MAQALLPLSGTWRAAEIGHSLREACEERLIQSRLAELLLARAPGELAGPALHAHLLGGVAAGSTAAGRALDAALLALPGLRAPRRRALALDAALAALSLGPGDQVGLLAPGNSPLALSIGARVEARGAVLQPIAVGPDGGVDLAALLGLLRGRAPAGPGLRALVVDGLPDILPDRQLHGLVGLLALLLLDRGRLLIGSTPPGEDLPLLDHLLRWPLLAREPEALASLLVEAAGPGELRLVESREDGLLLLDRHRRAP
jgi:hypothetical protein